MSIISDINNGLHDHELAAIISAAQSRNSLTPSPARNYTLVIGDRVVFNSHVSPKYMVGQQGTVVKVNRSTVKLKLDNQIGRFKCFGNTKAPLSIIDKISP